LAIHYESGAILKRCAAAVHVEANDDAIFWKKVFDRFLPQYSFDFITYSHTPTGAMATGSSNCLRYHRLGCLSRHFIVCIDSDYRRLLGEEDLDVEHWVFQTYTHSIENHYCFQQNIADVFRRYDCKLFDATAFFKDYSASLYRLFIFYLISKSKYDGRLTDKEFNLLIGIEPRGLDEKEILDGLKQRIASKLAEMETLYSPAEADRMSRKCRKAGLTADNAYLYFRGHSLLNTVVKKILSQLGRATRSGIDMGRHICFDQYNEINKIKEDCKKYEYVV
jgi:UDP-N-acetylglucosamine transferase subunit ALG13